MDNQGIFRKSDTNDMLKFYYSLLAQRQTWLKSEADKNLKKMAALSLLNTAILLAVITILLHKQL